MFSPGLNRKHRSAGFCVAHLPNLHHIFSSHELVYVLISRLKRGLESPDPPVLFLPWSFFLTTSPLAAFMFVLSYLIRFPPLPPPLSPRERLTFFTGLCISFHQHSLFFPSTIYPTSSSHDIPSAFPFLFFPQLKVKVPGRLLSPLSLVPSLFGTNTVVFQSADAFSSPISILPPLSRLL